jgi:hypothetical protein
MELSKKTLEELEKFFEEENIEDKIIQVPFLNNAQVPGKLILAIIEYSRNKLRNEIESKIEEEFCIKLSKGFVKLINYKS